MYLFMIHLAAAAAVVSGEKRLCCKKSGFSQLRKKYALPQSFSWSSCSDVMYGRFISAFVSLYEKLWRRFVVRSSFVSGEWKMSLSITYIRRTKNAWYFLFSFFRRLRNLESLGHLIFMG